MNKKTVFAATIVLLLIVSLNFGQSRKAVHITEGQCGLLDGDGNKVVTDDVKIVITNSENGNLILRCKTQGVENNQGTAVHWDAWTNPDTFTQLSADPAPKPCVGTDGTSMLITEDWQIVVSKKGNAMMTCRFRTAQD
jgi:hypothetical protein